LAAPETGAEAPGLVQDAGSHFARRETYIGRVERADVAEVGGRWRLSIRFAGTRELFLPEDDSTCSWETIIREAEIVEPIPVRPETVADPEPPAGAPSIPRMLRTLLAIESRIKATEAESDVLAKRKREITEEIKAEMVAQE